MDAHLQKNEIRSPILTLYKKNNSGAGEMAQQVKGLATKPDDLSSVPGAYMVEGENQFL